MESHYDLQSKNNCKNYGLGVYNWEVDIFLLLKGEKSGSFYHTSFLNNLEGFLETTENIEANCIDSSLLLEVYKMFLDHK